MASPSQRSMDYLRAIETLSQEEEPLNQAVSDAGPGGEAYGRAPVSFPRGKPRTLLQKAAGFLKGKGTVVIAIAVGAAAVWAGRQYWNQH